MSDSDISKMIKITESPLKIPDATCYIAELLYREVGYVSKEINQSWGFEKMRKHLTSRICEGVYREVIIKLDAMRLELYKEARAGTFETYQCKVDMAEKIGDLIRELRGL